jgi:hypothetical protein
MPAKIFESVTFHFNHALPMRFEIFDFALAQKWASLLAGQLGLDPSRRVWWVRVDHSRLEDLADELEFRVLSLHGDEEFRAFRLRWRHAEHRYSPESLRALNAELARLVRAGMVWADESEVIRLEHAQDIVSQALQMPDNQPRASLRCRFRLSGHETDEQVMSLPVLFEDLPHFTHERMPGGLRPFRFFRNGIERSAMDCADSRNFTQVPIQTRSYSADFRVDLKEKFSPFYRSHPYQRLQSWAEKTGFSLGEKAQWADYLYVARLCPEDLARIDLIIRTLRETPRVRLTGIELTRPAGHGKASPDFVAHGGAPA